MQGSVSRVLHHRVRNAAKVSELILGIAPSPPQADREEPLLHRESLGWTKPCRNTEGGVVLLYHLH